MPKMPMTMLDLKQRAIDHIDGAEGELWQISSTLHENPELGFHEFQAYELLTSSLAKHGYTLDHKIAGLETAFRASLGNDSSPVVAVLAEYDALPVLGHACGHNLIPAAGLGAALGVAS